MNLTDLIARVETAGANRPFCVSQDIGEFFKQPTRYEHPGSENPVHLNYCHSLDAALALVERCHPAAMPEIWQGSDGDWGAHFRRPPTDSEYASTPALALILALLRALADAGASPSPRQVVEQPREAS